ncbi:MAG TPA: type IV toxin-antitoxin system AbiEi family antitoxin domain-containing protein [Acetobacteraceae bacterium]|nr:type IV toxin-antitoxin system AbiEi family antitoxin domain-containing protein [Acetobacteraceae bacterium]
MPPPPRFPRTSAPHEIECAGTAGSPRFPHSRFEGVEYWTEERDLRLAAEAARTGGVVTTSLLRTSGFSEAAITAALRRGLLTRWGRGVYLVGPLTDELTEARAVTTAIPHGALGFGAAAQMAAIGPIAVLPLDLIVPPGRHAARAGVRVHRIDLSPRDVTWFEGLRTTTPSVTIVHLARTLPELPFERVVQEAFAKRLTNTRQLELALDRHRGGRGTARLRRMLELGVDDLRSKAERSLRHSVRAASLPSPQFNAKLGPWKVDAYRPGHRLAVEINGYAAHSSPWAHDRDHRKEQFLQERGLATRRFTALQAIDEPVLVIARIAVALAVQKR